ncbi:AlbA family DNA-binding domain-containing protein [Spirosoma jeollabukense]
MATSFTETHLGKTINEVKVVDLITYFSTEHDESLTLEFKSFHQKEGDIRHKENGVLRTICGFLNSNGGLLIWGAPIGTKKANGQKVFTGDLSPVEKHYTRDDFIRMVSNRIIPFVAPVQFRDIEIEAGKFVYLIDVPESEAKPHQFDNIYYMRLDGQTKIAPHYIIDALFKQVKIPSLKVFLRLDEFTHLSGEVTYNSVNLLMTCFLINSSRFVHEYEPYYILQPGAGGIINKATNEVEKFRHIYEIPSLKILTYNLPVIRQEIFHLTMDQHYEWCDKSLSIPITIVGGGRLSPLVSSGRLSPLVSSSYELELVDASKNKDLVLSRQVPVDRVIKLKPIHINQFKHDEWTGSEEERLNSIINKSKARN